MFGLGDLCVPAAFTEKNLGLIADSGKSWMCQPGTTLAFFGPSNPIASRIEEEDSICLLGSESQATDGRVRSLALYASDLFSTLYPALYSSKACLCFDNQLYQGTPCSLIEGLYMVAEVVQPGPLYVAAGKVKIDTRRHASIGTHADCAASSEELLAGPSCGPQIEGMPSVQIISYLHI